MWGRATWLMDGKQQISRRLHPSAGHAEQDSAHPSIPTASRLPHCAPVGRDFEKKKKKKNVLPYTFSPKSQYVRVQYVCVRVCTCVCGAGGRYTSRFTLVTHSQGCRTPQVLVMIEISSGSLRAPAADGLTHTCVRRSGMSPEQRKGESGSISRTSFSFRFLAFAL